MTILEHLTIRRSVIAGSWYPGTEQSLAKTVNGYLANVDHQLVDGELLGLISPHAGYTYSGQTAAHAYHQLQGQNTSTVVLIGPSHRAWVDDYAVSAEDAYETPLGPVPLDRGFIAKLADKLPLQRIQGDAEHSLEIQLPFLQRQLGDFRLVPILTSADDPSSAQRLGTALSGIIGPRSGPDSRYLLVASSDLHHIEDYDIVVRRDGDVVEAIGAFDLGRLTPLLMDRRCSVCGRMPILAVLHACQALGADAVKILYYTNSGEVTGQRGSGQYTVGYLAAAIYRSR